MEIFSSDFAQNDSVLESKHRYHEELKQENYALTNQLDHKLKMNEEAFSQINSIKNEISSKSTKFKNNTCFLKENLNKEISNIQNKIDLLEERARKDQSMKKSNRKSQINLSKQYIQSDSNEDTIKEIQEIEKLKQQEKDMRSRLSEYEKKYKLIENEIIAISEEISKLNDHLKQKKEQLKELKSTFTDLSEEITIKEIELNSEQNLQENDQENDHKERGNSLFAEVVDNENIIKKSFINLKHKFKKTKEMLFVKEREINIIEKQRQQLLEKLTEIVNLSQNMEFEENHKMFEEKIKNARINRRKRLEEFIKNTKIDKFSMYLEAFNEEIEEKEIEFLEISQEQYLQYISLQNAIKEYYSSINNYIKSSDELDELKFKYMNLNKNKNKADNNDESIKEITKTLTKKVQICDTVIDNEENELSRKEKLDKMRINK